MSSIELDIFYYQVQPMGKNRIKIREKNIIGLEPNYFKTNNKLIGELQRIGTDL